MTTAADSPHDGRTLARLRRLLLATLAVGAAGTAAELLLLDHTEGWQQLLPLGLLGIALLMCAWQAVRPTALTVRLLQILMVLFIAGGALGVLLHYQGNVAFELEMYPTMEGFELVSNTMTGATPVLAPGTMLVLGLVGLAYTYRHPRIAPRLVSSATVYGDGTSED